MFDVIVVGAGPTGCVAAKEAVKHGLRVGIFEEHEKVGIPIHCAGLVSKNGLDSLGVDYRKAVLNEINGAWLYPPNGGEKLCVRAKKVKAIVLDRAKFDEICSNEAEKEGACVFLGKKAKKDELTSKVIIGADGAFSQTSEWFGFPKITNYISCIQAEFDKVYTDKNMVSVFFSSSFAPGFFGWLIPINEEQVRVGIGVSASLNIKKYFDKFITIPPLLEVLKNAKVIRFSGGFIPIEIRKKTVKHNVMLVGDAAGQVKASTGGGIYFGCSSAKIAGKVAGMFIENGISLETYEKEWREKYEKKLRLHLKIRKFLNALSDTQLENIFKFAKKVKIEEFLVKYGDVDDPSNILKKFPISMFFSDSFGGSL